ncbi:D-ser-dehydrat domain-containing protein [Mycena chlorophos]|uniref:D-serine dehydratase n=1 Tax=Mycena chlorophos TaxID=658473 RepID=A0A8H6SKS8_MYCCL|nr:D-ser-dehydrat domain-containing protein [Mycena chlorophos]
MRYSRSFLSSYHHPPAMLLPPSFQEPPTTSSLASARASLVEGVRTTQLLGSQIVAAKDRLVQNMTEAKNAIDDLEREQRLAKENVAQMLAYLAPVRRLPGDVLNEVFVWCFEEHPCVAWVLATVCRTWRRQALAMPRLWSKIRLVTNQSSSPDTVRLWLERSGQTAPLDIEIYLRVVHASGDAAPPPPINSYRRPHRRHELPPSYIPAPPQNAAPGVQTSPHFTPESTPTVIPQHHTWESPASGPSHSAKEAHWGHVAVYYLVKEMHRWQRFIFRFEKGFASLGALKAISGSAPLLKEFEVSCAAPSYFPPEWSWLPTLPATSASIPSPLPSLESLTLQYTPFRPSAPLFLHPTSRLHTLVLRALPAATIPLDQLVAILKANQASLTVLKMHLASLSPAVLPLPGAAGANANNGPNNNSGLNPANQLTLASLEELHVGGHHMLTSLVDTLVVPLLTTLEVDVDIAREPIEETIVGLVTRSSGCALKVLGIGYGWGGSAIRAGSSRSGLYNPLPNSTNSSAASIQHALALTSPPHTSGSSMIAWNFLADIGANLEVLKVGGCAVDGLLNALVGPEDNGGFGGFGPGFGPGLPGPAWLGAGAGGAGGGLFGGLGGLGMGGPAPWMPPPAQIQLPPLQLPMPPVVGPQPMQMQMQMQAFMLGPTGSLIPTQMVPMQMAGTVQQVPQPQPQPQPATAVPPPSATGGPAQQPQPAQPLPAAPPQLGPVPQLPQPNPVALSTVTIVPTLIPAVAAPPGSLQLPPLANLGGFNAGLGNGNGTNNGWLCPKLRELYLRGCPGHHPPPAGTASSSSASSSSSTSPAPMAASPFHGHMPSHHSLFPAPHTNHYISPYVHAFQQTLAGAMNANVNYGPNHGLGFAAAAGAGGLGLGLGSGNGLGAGPGGLVGGGGSHGGGNMEGVMRLVRVVEGRNPVSLAVNWNGSSTPSVQRLLKLEIEDCAEPGVEVVKWLGESTFSLGYYTMQTFTPYALANLPSKDALVKEFVGKPFEALRTPAFVIDRTVFKNNCVRMLQNAQSWGASLRCHLKTHKTVEGARFQLDEGELKTHAVVVSTLAEAWQVVEGGLVKDGLVKDILYGLPVALNKVADLSALWDELAKYGAVVRLMVDHPDQIKFLEEFEKARPNPRRWSVFVKIDGGQRRAGVPTSSDRFVPFLKTLFDSPAVSVYGFYIHAGNAYASTSASEASAYLSREVNAVNDAAAIALPLLAASTNAALYTSPFVLSVGSTPTAHAATPDSAVRSAVSTLNGTLELHAGNYPMNDLQQKHTTLISDEHIAQRVLATVVSHYPGRAADGTGDEAMCDAGAIAMSKDTGPSGGFGDVVGRPWRVGRISQEHGILTPTVPGAEAPKVGEVIEIVGQHACLIAAAYPWYYIVEDGGRTVVDVWVAWKGW